MAGVSLVLCVLTSALWLESYRHKDFVNWNSGWLNNGRRNREFEICIKRGSLEIGWEREDWNSPPPPNALDIERKWLVGRDAENDISSIFWQQDNIGLVDPKFGFAHYVGEFGGRSNFFGRVGWIGTHRSTECVLLPIGLFCGVLLWLPILQMIRHHRDWRRHSENACPNCGYDLRATPDRCPECGKIT